MKEKIEALIATYNEQLAEYQQLVADAENRGLDNLDYEETEDYGAYSGSVNVLERVIADLQKLLE